MQIYIKQLAGTAVIAAALLGGCGTSDDTESAPVIRVGESDDTFWANSTVEDWATMATQLSVVEVLAETVEPLESETGEGYQPRTVTLRIVDTVWADNATPWPGIETVERQMAEQDSAGFDPTASFDASPLDGEFEFIANGWAVSGDERTPFVSDHGVRLEVGGTYLMPLLPFDAVGDWATASFNAVMPLVDGSVQFDEEIAPHWAAASFVGLTPAEAADLYVSPPEPIPDAGHDE